MAEDLAASFSGLPVARSGVERHLFASSLSPKGYVHYLESILGPLTEVYVLKDHVQLLCSLCPGAAPCRCQNKGFVC